jgi:hypothetical protein
MLEVEVFGVRVASVDNGAIQIEDIPENIVVVT